MVFNSPHFAVFFIIVTSLYFLIPHKFRWLLLLVSSYYFYMTYIPIYVLILEFTIIIDYFSGIVIEESEGYKRKLFLIISLISNIGVLAIFKYFNFFNNVVSQLSLFFGYHNPIPFLSWALPIGLSFHTFQAMSYTIEVYRKNQKAERNFGIYSLYVMFYPQLVAGPIERPQNLIHQFYEKHNFDYTRVTNGLKLMAWGLFKKIVIADRLSVLVDYVFNSPYKHHGLSFLIAAIFFSFQIFCDFSGYSDMAIGIASVMGFKLMKNFNNPYHAKSVREFWTRWHISLSTWFKDYLYIPLGGNRVSTLRLCLNLFIVFMISGLWHGANWTFLIWGALHGFYIIISIASQKLRRYMAKKVFLDRLPTLNNFLKVLVTFTLVTFAWIFFRANTIGQAFYISKSIITDSFGDIPNLIGKSHTGLDLKITKMELLLSIIFIFFLEGVQILHSRYNLIKVSMNYPAYYRWTVYYLFLFTMLYFISSSSHSFIYFQF